MRNLLRKTFSFKSNFLLVLSAFYVDLLTCVAVAASLLQLRCCSFAVAASLLQLRCCSFAVAASLLQLRCCSFAVAASLHLPCVCVVLLRDAAGKKLHHATGSAAARQDTSKTCFAKQLLPLLFIPRRGIRSLLTG